MVDISMIRMISVIFIKTDMRISGFGGMWPLPVVGRCRSRLETLASTLPSSMLSKNPKSEVAVGISLLMCAVFL